MSEQPHNQCLTGRGLSPGLAEGIAYVHRDVAVLPSEHYDIEMHEVDGELERLENGMPRTHIFNLRLMILDFADEDVASLPVFEDGVSSKM